MIVPALAAAALLTVQTPPPDPIPRVAIHTDRGDIIVALDYVRAPATTCNFLNYVRSGRYRGARFFRTVISTTDASPHPIDVIQAETTAGSDDPGLGPIPLERTRDTGLAHVAGTISMARDGPDTATSSFFIVTRDTPALDFGGGRSPDGQGFGAFGRVISGLDVALAIQGLPAVDERIQPPVAISDIELIDNVPNACNRYPALKAAS